MTRLALPLIALVLSACATGGDPAPEPPAEMQVVALEHVDAGELAATLGAFLADAQLVDGVPAKDAAQVMADTGSNSIFVKADAERLEEILALVERLDQPR